MTRPIGGAHPDFDQLADIDAGLDPGGDVRTHVATCDDCQQALAALRSTRSDLAHVSLPEMPADVVARMDAVLADEAVGTVAGGADATVVPLAAHTSRKRRGYLAGGVAAAVIAALVTAIVLNSASGKPGGQTAASGGSAGLGSQATAVVTASGRNYTQQTLDADVAALLNKTVNGSGLSAGAAAGTAGKSATGSGPVHGPAVAPVPSPPKLDSARSTLEFAAPQSLAVLRTDPTAMSQCITNLLGAPPYVAPLAVDIGRYNKQPAAVFVFPKPGDPAHVRVYVVPAGGCASGFFEFYKNAVPR